MHEHFEHTADLGLRAIAADLETLFIEMGHCLFAAIVEEPSSIEPKFETNVLIEGTDPEYLMFDWLRHLLHLFENGWLYRDFEVKLTESGLNAIAFGEPIDRDRHQLSHEVKAITYHELKIQPHDGGWIAEVIVDI